MHADGTRQVHPVTSLHVLERLLSVMSFTPFLDLLISLLCPRPDSRTDSQPSSLPADITADRTSSGSFASTSQTTQSSDQQHRSFPAVSNPEAAAAVDGSTNSARSAATAEGGAASAVQSEASPWQALFALHENSTAYRDCFLQILHGNDGQLVCAAVRALVAIVQSKAASPHVLSSAGQSLPL